MHCPVTLDAGCHGRAYRRFKHVEHGKRASQSVMVRAGAPAWPPRPCRIAGTVLHGLDRAWFPRPAAAGTKRRPMGPGPLVCWAAVAWCNCSATAAGVDLPAWIDLARRLTLPAPYTDCVTPGRAAPCRRR